MEEISIGVRPCCFKAKRNFTTHLMKKARREFYSNFIDKNSGDKKKLFRANQRLYLTTQWMMVSHLIWTVELSLTTWEILCSEDRYYPHAA